MKDFDLSAFLADLRTLCAIDSGHFNAPGTAAVADFFESRYRALGLKTERRYYDNNDFAPFLTARNSEDEQIDVLFVAHMDTVFPVGTGAQWPLEVGADGLAHGPGCIDCKGGCLSLYYLLRQMLQTGDCQFRFCVAMNSDEERGSAYSRPYFEALAQKSRYCFVFEPGRPNEEFVSQRKGGANYIFKCHGISAHSGVEPEKGASAILELSRWVNELYKLNDFAAGTTVNVGALTAAATTAPYPTMPSARSATAIWTPPRWTGWKPFCSGCRPSPSTRARGWRSSKSPCARPCSRTRRPMPCSTSSSVRAKRSARRSRAS